VTIELIGLVVFGHHGYLEEERRLGQRFLVDLWVDVRGDAARTDRIEDTVDYRRLAGLVREVFAGDERLLLEGLAGAVADGIVGRFPTVERARVRVRKPYVVLDPPVDFAAVLVERSRAGRAHTSGSARTSGRAR
jgi:dihydroneopterin aldolase